jgi:hypothetical protein
MFAGFEAHGSSSGVWWVSNLSPLGCKCRGCWFLEIRDQILGFTVVVSKSHNLDGQWNGWGTALKPAHEPILMARKPFKSTVAENMVALVPAHSISTPAAFQPEQLSGGAGCLLSHQRDGTEPAADYEQSVEAVGQRTLSMMEAMM